MTRPLDASTWDDFADLVERNNGVYGGCWCIAHHAVYQRGGQTAALIGSKTVKPGDQLEGAGRVVDVDQAGLMLEVKK